MTSGLSGSRDTIQGERGRHLHLTLREALPDPAGHDHEGAVRPLPPSFTPSPLYLLTPSPLHPPCVIAAAQVLVLNGSQG